MGINPSTAKTKLRRGREKLKEVLLEGGYGVE
jgi:DNA-directed RNA polymerase specialized sigma24 family protein